jgi:hypothetical protein
MESSQIDMLPENLFTGNRNKLIPGWMRLFSWLFLVLGAFALLGLALGIFGYKFSIAMYGLETQEPFSIIGIFLFVVFAFKAVVAYGFLKKTDFAITLGLIDAIAGVCICCSIMLFPLVYPEYQTGSLFRLELLVLIPYLLKLKKIKPQWESVVEE